MPNLASTLKQEITRLARKEIRVHLKTLRKSSTQYRGEIAVLKREAVQLKAALARLGKGMGRAGAKSAESDEGGVKPRFSVRSVVAQRKRLGLSAADFGKLLGVSGATIYGWESGKTRPRRSQLAKMGTVRGLGKREAKKRLAGE